MKPQHNRPRSAGIFGTLFTAVAASLAGFGRGFSAERIAQPSPQPAFIPSPADDVHSGPTRLRSAGPPPRPKRAKRRRTLHADKAARYLRFCWSAKPWGARTPIEHAHGAQRRNAAILKNTGYEQRSRHVGTRWTGPARDSDTNAGELTGLSLR